MIGWILHACHRQPTVMNGAVMKNFVTPVAPFASALVGDPELFVSEVDESDGSIALYRPEVAVLTNISLDHKEMDELRSLFAGFLARVAQGGASTSTIRKRARSPTPCRRDKVIGYGFDSPGADFMGKDLELRRRRRHASRSKPKASGTTSGSPVPGRHNASNALAAIAAARALGVPLEDAVAALAPLRRPEAPAGDGRRTPRGVTVIDDFAHNPDKIAATLATLRAQPGRLLIMFQPHGYGPLAKMGEELAESFAAGWRRTTGCTCPTRSTRAARSSKSRGSDWLAERGAPVTASHAEHIPERAAIGDALVGRGARPATAS